MMLITIREFPVTLQEIKREAQEDELISATKQKIADKNQQIADIFSLCDNVLLYGERVVISKTLQKLILKDFLACRPGKNRMQSYVYWPKWTWAFLIWLMLARAVPWRQRRNRLPTTVAKDRPTLDQDSRGFRKTNGRRLLLDCSWQLHKVARSP